MGSALLRNVLEKVGLREPNAEDYEDEFEEAEGTLGEVHEFPHSTEVDEPEKKEAVEAQTQPQGPVFNRIKTSKPTSYNDAPEIGNCLRDNIPVILNLSYMGKPEAQRMVDFVSGLCYGLDGRLELVGEHLFLLTPKGIATVTDQTQTPSFLPKRY